MVFSITYYLGLRYAINFTLKLNFTSFFKGLQVLLQCYALIISYSTT
jgi:hypothetical protein